MPVIPFTTLNDPNGSFDTGSFRGGLVPVVRYNGVIGELRIGAVDHPDDGGIVIDTTHLQANNIVVYDEINGRSNVLLKAVWQRGPHECHRRPIHRCDRDEWHCRPRKQVRWPIEGEDQSR